MTHCKTCAEYSLKQHELVLLALLLVFSGARATPGSGFGAIKKGGKVIKKGLGVIGAIGTGHEVYQHVKDRRG